jgi:hypothetical protein
METKFILINSLHEHLILSVFDYNEHLKDTMLGSATFDMAALEQDATHEGIVSPILRDGKEKGNLRFDVTYYPVLKPHMVDGKEELPETSKHKHLFLPFFPWYFLTIILFPRGWHRSPDCPPSQRSRRVQVALG